LAFLLAAWTPTSRARASGAAFGNLEGPEWTLTPGLSAGLFVAPDGVAGSVTTEITGGWRLFWLTLGLRSAFQPEATHFLPFVEAGAYLLVNVGVGYSVGISRAIRDDTTASGVPRHNVHLFIGLPIPLNFGGPADRQRRTQRAHRGWRDLFQHGLFLEPYYRPSWGRGGGHEGWSHEVGLLLKYHWGWGTWSISS
jgi:hypothetical protein